MITFINLGKYGRLGNQLYQYAALKSCSLKNKYICKIPDISNTYWHGQKCLLNNFQLTSELLTQEDISSIRHEISEPIGFTGEYLNILENIKDNTNINGFFQNTKYFLEYEKEIKNEFNFKEDLLRKEIDFINNLKEDKYDLVSLHIRTGDMTDGTNSIYNKYYGKHPLDKNSVFGNYINNALEYFSELKNIKILVFVGGSRTGDDSSDIRMAKNYFNDSKFIVNDSNEPMTDFIRISLCNHNIISFSSTFSWWAAFLNKNINKTVICPKNFHIEKNTSCNNYFYPKEWIQI
jgi:hypothetical protein